MLYKKYKQISGFTLIEILVATAIFAVASVIIGGIFMNATNLQRQSANVQRLQNEGRYMIEKIAREIRGRELDLYNSSSTALVFKKDESGNVVTIQYRSSSSLAYTSQDGTANLNAADVRIPSLKFFIYPQYEYIPGTSTPTINVQPRVTILMKIVNNDIPKYQKQITIQTTISSKIYNR